MKGAIIGDIVGSIYEHHNIKTKEFPLFQNRCFFTDDTVMTAAVADALMQSYRYDKPLYDTVEECLHTYGKNYPHRGYGGRFKKWLYEEHPEPYESYGNGAPMRSSPAGWITNEPQKAYQIGEATAMPTHNHPEGMKAAGVVAELVCRARNGESMEQLKKVALSYYGIQSLNKMRDWYYFDVSSQGTMPAALTAFFESVDFEDAIRNAISLGGDSDTIAAITGAIAEAYYGVPEEIWSKAASYLDEKIIDCVMEYYDFAKEMV